MDETMRDVTPEEIEEFIAEHHPRKEWRESDKVRPWLNWMILHKCLDAFTDDGEQIAVLLSCRMSTEEDVENDFHIDPNGNCLVIDLIVANRKHQKFLLGSIGKYLIDKYGFPDSVYWRRGDHGPKTVPSKRLAARLG